MSVWWLAVAHAEPPAERVVLVLLRSLAYDRALPARVVGDLDVVVVADERGAEAVLEPLASLHGTLLAGHRIGQPEVVTVGPGLGEALDRIGPDVLLVTPGTDARGAGRWAEANGVLVLGLDAACVGAGCALGVQASEDRLGLVIELEAAERVGARFSPEFLEVVTVR